MEHTINRNYIFNLLKNLNYSCNKDDYFNKAFKGVKKFDNLVTEIDLDCYDVSYVQNRFIAIKNKSVPLNKIRKIIFCPFNTAHNTRLTECENTTFYFDTCKRVTYLTKPIDNSQRTEFETSTNYRDCIKGCMESALLDAIILYMLNSLMISNDTLIIYGLKYYDSAWSSLDVLEWLQGYGLNKHNSSFESIIDIDYTSAPKGLPIKDYMGRIEIGVKKLPKIMDHINEITHIEENEMIKNLNYSLKVNRNLQLLYDQDFHFHKDLSNYFDSNILAKFKLDCFTDKLPSNKFSTFFMDYPFLVQWESIEKFINLLSSFDNI